MMQNNGGDGTSEREVGSGTQEAHYQTVRRWGAAPREPQGIKNPQKSPSGVKFPGLIALYFQTKPRVESRGGCGPPVLDDRSWNPRGRWLATGARRSMGSKADNVAVGGLTTQR